VCGTFGDLHRVGSPDEKSEASNGNEEGANLLALGLGLSTSIDSQVPDNDKVGNAGNGVPAPLLRGSLRAESSEQTSENHDNIGDDSHCDVGTIHASKQAEIEQKERSGEGPIDISSPVDLALDFVGGFRDVLMLGANSRSVD
jgi:hypothetical protein